MTMTPMPMPGPGSRPVPQTQNMDRSARHRMDVSMDGKVAQSEAQYQTQSQDPSKRCEECENFLEPSSCRLVAGVIAPDGTCILFTPETNESPAEDKAEGGEPAGAMAPVGP